MSSTTIEFCVEVFREKLLFIYAIIQYKICVTLHNRLMYILQNVYYIIMKITRFIASDMYSYG